MPDEMEPGAGAAVELGTLRLKLLDIVFTKIAKTKFVGFAHHCGRKFLGDHSRRDLIGPDERQQY